MTANTQYISLWESKESSTENITPPATSDNSLPPALSYCSTKTRVKFTGRCLNNPKHHTVMAQ